MKNRRKAISQRNKSGTSADDILLGSKGNDVLEGLDGDDFLDGRGGKDKLLGGRGDDSYLLRDQNATVVEKFDEGIDTIQSYVTLKLPENVEALELEGKESINGIGNGLENDLLGNNRTNHLDGKEGIDLIIARGGSDRLDGGTGSDIFIGGAGDDTYVVDDEIDICIEKVINDKETYDALEEESQLAALPDAGGVDWVESSINFTLPQDPTIFGQIENIRLTGNQDLVGYGNDLNNAIAGNKATNDLRGLGGDDALNGNDGDDILDGGDGNDVLIGGTGTNTLVGGSGLDGFVYATGSSFTTKKITVNIIMDFTLGDDLIAVSKKTFPLLKSKIGGGLAASGDFASVATDAKVESSNALIVFSRETFGLFYNPDRDQTGNSAAKLFTALFQGPLIDENAFFVIK